MKQAPFNLILLGDPGAGKGTQGVRLTKKYALREFDFGSWLRALKSPAARKKYNITATLQGILAPTNLAKIKFREVIETTPKGKGVFFNGNPKMEGEAKVVVKAFKGAGRKNVFVLYISIPREEMLKRLHIRKAVEGRKDDDREHLKNRMRYYREHIRPTVAFLRTKYPFKKINGLGTEKEVFERIVKAIEKLQASAS